MSLTNKNEYNSYMNNYMKERWARRRLQAIIHLGECCSECLVSYKLVPMHFHHVDPSSKVATVARLSSASERKFWEEINKCVLLCDECHIEHHKS